MGISLIEIDSLAMHASPEQSPRELSEMEERTIRHATAEIQALQPPLSEEQVRKTMQRVFESEPDYLAHIPAGDKPREPHPGSIFTIFHRAMNTTKLSKRDCNDA